ncbi:MAG: OmpA family protein [Bryobacterales bacterium]|nr:OmpA family protein [Bryobacterales bacterium]
MRLMLIAPLAAGLAIGQQPTQTTTTVTTTNTPGATTVHQSDAVFRVDVVGRTAKAINYRHRGGATKIDFKGTALLPKARGEAKVESKQGYIEIEVEFDELEPATKFGPEYLTYVMWAITPDGRATNLGEVLLNGNRSKLNVTTELQQFALVITAEPYYAVSMPSDLVVMENVIRRDTKGKVDEVEAKYELLQRGQYTKYTDTARLSAVRSGRSTPIEILEARNAMMIAEGMQAPKYAADTYQKARDALNRAEDYLARQKNVGSKPIAMMAREAVQRAEDARAIAVKRMEEERLAQERADAAAREAAARASAEREAQQRAEADRQRAAAEADRQRAIADAERASRERAEASRLKAEEEARRLAAERQALEAQRKAQEAQAQSAEAARLKAEEEARRLAAEREAMAAKQRADDAQAEASRAQQAVAEAQRLREQAERERQQLRQQLLDQLNVILETRDTARGLIVNMSDVLFDFGKYTLRPGARERLAKLSGVVLAHPGLKLDIEGHTDSIGSEQFNQKLSEDRAQAVRDYLVAQGLRADNITSKGFGKTRPVASNDTNEGRQQNRRVEIVVSGDIIGTSVSSNR